MTGQETFGRGTTRHGAAAIVKRSAVMSSGDNSLSAIRLSTKAKPQITATRTATQTSAGFIFVVLSPASSQQKRHCERKRSNPGCLRRKGLDCFVVSLLAMTIGSSLLAVFRFAQQI